MPDRIPVMRWSLHITDIDSGDFVTASFTIPRDAGDRAIKDAVERMREEAVWLLAHPEHRPGSTLSPNLTKGGP